MKKCNAFNHMESEFESHPGVLRTNIVTSVRKTHSRKSAVANGGRIT